MDVGRFATLLKSAIGLDITSIGTTALEHAVRDRQRACGVIDHEAYWRLVCGSTEERQALVEAVVVPETWFFRDKEAFAALVRVVRNTWLPQHRDGVYRILSVPCSTGEEPYSVAMTLLDEGIPPQRFRIDAVDVSARSLDRARQGLYGRGAFRGADVTYRERHFLPDGSAYSVRDYVRRPVAFHRGNIVGNESFGPAACYEAIFCRNLLIYFDEPTQARALGVLSRLLTPEGVLFVGPAETGVLLRHGFASTREPLAFAFRTATREPSKPALADGHPRRSGFVGIPHTQRVRRRSRLLGSPLSDSPGKTLRPSGDPCSLEAGFRLADEGRFEEAESHCEDYLKRNGPSAQAFHLLGLVKDAVGRHADAVACYRKALYLDPRHRDTLVHLALLMEAQDNGAEAARLRSRARRAAASGEA